MITQFVMFWTSCGYTMKHSYFWNTTFPGPTALKCFFSSTKKVLIWFFLFLWTWKCMLWVFIRSASLRHISRNIKENIFTLRLILFCNFLLVKLKRTSYVCQTCSFLTHVPGQTVHMYIQVRACTVHIFRGMDFATNLQRRQHLQTACCLPCIRNISNMTGSLNPCPAE